MMLSFLKNVDHHKWASVPIIARTDPPLIHSSDAVSFNVPLKCAQLVAKGASSEVARLIRGIQIHTNCRLYGATSDLAEVHSQDVAATGMLPATDS